MDGITLEKLIEHLPKYISLTYVDRNDDLSNRAAELQRCVSTGYTDAIDAVVDTWYYDGREEGVEEVLKELKESFPEDVREDVEAAITEYREELEDVICEKDTSDPVDGLFGNTCDSIMFYDTGLYCDADWDASDAHKRLVRMKIKNTLGLKDSQWDHDIMEMIENGFCGNLEIYFKKSVRDFIADKTEGVHSIKFGKHLNVGIINHREGSGHNVYLKGAETVMPFDRDRLFVEGAVSYSWTYDIAGMCGDWCDDTEVTFDAGPAGPVQLELNLSNLGAHIKEEAELDRVFKSGKCTFGDMKMSRHRNTVYINEYPCGTHCKDCGTFWVD